MELDGVISNYLNNYGRGCKIMVGLHGNVFWKRLVNNHLMSKNISMILIRHDVHIIQFAPRMIEKLNGFTKFLNFSIVYIYLIGDSFNHDWLFPLFHFVLCIFCNGFSTYVKK
jgi:hypothetical protein